MKLNVAEFLNWSVGSRVTGEKMLKDIEKDTEVKLDFTNVRLISQNFADEIFRVQPLKGGFTVIGVGMCKDVGIMIEHIMSNDMPELGVR